MKIKSMEMGAEAAREILADLIASANTEIAWVDAEPGERNEQKRLHINISTDALYFVISQHVTKIINKKDVEKNTEEGEGCGNCRFGRRVKITSCNGRITAD